jgi:hypothetical protein
MELFIEREDTRRICSYGLVVLVQECEELLTGVKFARSEVEFIQLWEDFIRKFDDKVNNMPEIKSKKLFENVTVCGNCHLVCKKVENLLKTKFMLKSSKSMNDLNSKSLITSQYVIGNSFSTDQLIKEIPKDNNEKDEKDDENSSQIINKGNENILSEYNIINTDNNNNNNNSNDDDMEIKMGERLYDDGSDLESITCDGMEDEYDDEPILPTYTVNKSKDPEIIEGKLAMDSPVKNQVKNILTPELTPSQKTNLEFINNSKIKMDQVIEQLVVEDVVDKKGKKNKTKITKLSDIFTHIGMIFPAAYSGTGGTK